MDAGHILRNLSRWDVRATVQTCRKTTGCGVLKQNGKEEPYEPEKKNKRDADKADRGYDLHIAGAAVGAVLFCGGDPCGGRSLSECIPWTGQFHWRKRGFGAGTE